MKKYIIDGLEFKAEACTYGQFVNRCDIDSPGYKLSSYSSCGLWSWLDKESFERISTPVDESISFLDALSRLKDRTAKKISSNEDSYIFIDDDGFFYRAYNSHEGQYDLRLSDNLFCLKWDVIE